MKPIIIIPARYASTRFPGKPLATINNKIMVQLVYEKCKEVTDLVYIATDDPRIEDAVKSFDGNVIITSSNHTSGTDRCAEAALKIANKIDFDIVVNVQGDEPFLSPEQIQLLISCFEEPNTEIATLIAPITSTDVLFDHNKVKVVTSVNNNALYFSRQALPYIRDVVKENWLSQQTYYLHIGMYGFRREILEKISKLSPSTLETAEKLEQLRWLENDITIKTAISKHVNFGVDTPEDLEQLLKTNLNL